MKHKRWAKIIKLSISIVSLGYITFLTWNNLDKLKDFELNSIIKNPLWLLVFALMPLNWFIESKKWELLISPLQQLRTSTAFQAVLSGLAISMFTPNRIGEFGGRIMFLDKKNRIPGALATWIGSLAQLSITIIVGMAGVFTILTHSQNFNELNDIYAITPWIVAFILLIIAISFIFGKNILAKITQNQPVLIKALDFLKTYTFNQIAKVFLLSLIRYVVFSTQFAIILHIYNIDLSLGIIFAGIASVYLITATIPSIALIEFGIRGSVAIFIFSHFGIDSLLILGATTSLWIVNIAIPAISGAIVINKIKI